MKSNLTKNIQRNSLDYIVTDLIPYEISRMINLNSFYSFLCKEYKRLDNVIQGIKESAASNDRIVFSSAISSMPLKYKILKSENKYREIFLLQPVALLNVYAFVEIFQKIILAILSENCAFSIRYHKNNYRLNYINKIGKKSRYRHGKQFSVRTDCLYENGSYFHVGPFNSINSFMSSQDWKNLKRKYDYFAHADYKSCFPSIYTHSYKWIKVSNTVDSKNADGSSLYLVIDKILQLINGKSSNGVVVGPEFSRMIVEILLQHIDVNVKRELLSLGMKARRDYDIRRYVDDIFIFAKNELEIDKIVRVIEDNANKFLLQLNESKFEKRKTSSISKPWLKSARVISELITKLFRDENDMSHNSGSEVFALKISKKRVFTIKNEILGACELYPQHKRSIVSYVLTTLYMMILNSKGKNINCKNNEEWMFLYLLELSFYLLSLFPCYEHSQKLVGILDNIDGMIDFRRNSRVTSYLHRVVWEYSDVFENSEFADISNLLLTLPAYKVSLPTNVEFSLLTKLKMSNNPVQMADFLMYSRYNKNFRKKVAVSIQDKISESIPSLDSKELMLLHEFWYVVIFIKCPYIDASLRKKMEDICYKIHSGAQDATFSSVSQSLVASFLLNDSLYDWYSRFGLFSRSVSYLTNKRCLYINQKLKKEDFIETSFS